MSSLTRSLYYFVFPAKMRSLVENSVSSASRGTNGDSRVLVWHDIFFNFAGRTILWESHFLWELSDVFTVNQIHTHFLTMAHGTAGYVRVYRSPRVTSDHYLLVAKFTLKLKQRHGTKREFRHLLLASSSNRKVSQYSTEKYPTDLLHLNQ